MDAVYRLLAGVGEVVVLLGAMALLVLAASTLV